MAAKATGPTLAALIDHLHRQVRLGNFADSQDLAERCLKHHDLAGMEEVRRLRAHTLAWEVYDSLGNSKRAQECLKHDAALFTQATHRLQLAIEKPSAFRKTEFPCEAGEAGRVLKYRLWRQRVFVQMAEGLCAYREHRLLRSAELLECAGRFIYECLIPAGFPCSGTLARLYFYKGLLAQRQRLLSEAGEHFDESLGRCLARLSERHPVPRSTEELDVDKAFATYCLGKLHVYMGELEFDKGRLTAARRYLSGGKTLILSTQDKFLALRADLLLCCVARSDRQFTEEGWGLLETFAKCRQGLTAHPAYSVEARTEEIKTAVYLHRERARIPGSPPRNGIANLDQALTATDQLIERARELKLRQSHYHALLMKARILIYKEQRNEARAAIELARDLYPDDGPPAPLAAEAAFVLAKTHTADKNCATALKHFREALRIGHESLVFQASCHLQIIEALERTKKLTEAREHLLQNRQLLCSVESSFLRKRYQELNERLNSRELHLFRFDDNFELKSAKDELEVFYLHNLAALIDRKPQDLRSLGFWHTVSKKRHGRDDRTQVLNLLKKHFPRRARARSKSS
jgi:tetratricopeptide (TPR) repeat protein